MMDINEVIKQIPFWKNLSDEEKKQLLSGAVLRIYKKDSYIYGMTDACLGMIYVQKGSIRVYITSEEGREITLFHIGSGECCVLSASCVIAGISLDVQLLAEEDTEIVAIHSGMIQKLMDSNIYARCFAYELATKRFSDVVWVMQEIMFARFDVRMARFLLSVYEKTGENKIQMTQEAIAKEVNVPIILYNVPSRTGTRLAPQTVVDLCHEVPNIVGVKDATGDISEVAELMSLAKGTVDVYSGNDDQIVPVLSLGGKGVISVLSNILPKETHDMVASYLEGDVAKSCEMQLKYFDLVKALFCEVNPIPVKKALNLMGMEVGSLRLPLTEMEDANAKRLEEEMRKAGVIK